MITASGPFSSSGAAFSNGLAIRPKGITINQTGTVILNAGLTSTGAAPINITGSVLTVSLGAPVTGTTVLFNAAAGVTINDTVTASGGLTSTGAGP